MHVLLIFVSVFDTHVPPTTQWKGAHVIHSVRGMCCPYQQARLRCKITSYKYTFLKKKLTFLNALMYLILQCYFYRKGTCISYALESYTTNIHMFQGKCSHAN